MLNILAIIKILEMKRFFLKTLIAGMLVGSANCCLVSAGDVTKYVNPLFGTTTLWDKKDLGYEMSENPIYRTVLKIGRAHV